MTDRKRSKTEERHLAQMEAGLERLELQFGEFEMCQRLVPPAWHAMDLFAPVAPPKQPLTLKLDADMVAWFRALGRGYQCRMNAILRAYMDAVIAKVIEREGDRDWRGEPI